MNAVKSRVEFCMRPARSMWASVTLTPTDIPLYWSILAWTVRAVVEGSQHARGSRTSTPCARFFCQRPTPAQYLAITVLVQMTSHRSGIVPFFPVANMPRMGNHRTPVADGMGHLHWVVATLASKNQAWFNEKCKTQPLLSTNSNFSQNLSSSIWLLTRESTRGLWINPDHLWIAMLPPTAAQCHCVVRRWTDMVLGQTPLFTVSTTFYYTMLNIPNTCVII